jgi:hypothetical protein
MVANDSNDENFMKKQRIGLSADTFIREFGPIVLVVAEVIPGTHYYPYEDCPTRINHIKQENVSEKLNSIDVSSLDNLFRGVPPILKLVACSLFGGIIFSLFLLYRRHHSPRL